MAPDDRDRSFEKALARHLRSSASPGVDSNALGGASRAACPDPEILAAYHDGSLTAEERILWKQHVLGCENCQLVLAHLETPLEIPVNAATKEPVLTKKRAAASAAAAAPSVSVARPRRPPSMRWLWLVPAGATAAGLVAWISLHQQKPVQVAQSPSVEVAENRQEPAAATPPAARSAQPERVAPRERKDLGSKEPEGKEKDQFDKNASREAHAAPSPNRDAAAQALNNRAQLAQQAPSQNAAAPAHGPSLNQQKQQQQMASGGAAGVVGGRILDQKKADASASLKAEERAKQQPAAPQPSPPGEPGFLADESVHPPVAQKTAPPPKPAPAPASASTADKSTATSTDVVSSMRETVEVTSDAPSLKKMRAAVLQDSHVFSAPDKKHLWRIGPAGWLEFSKDKGAQWTFQLSGVSTDLIAGSAPNAKICWVVGRSGTILRTTDAGDHWTRLDSPEAGDLAGVTATDDLHAKISFAPDPQTGLTRTYETTDGGATWSLVRNE